MSQCTGPVQGTCPRATQIRLLLEKPCPGCPTHQKWDDPFTGQDYAASDRDDTTTIRKG